MDEVSDDEFDPRLEGLDDANRQSWEMISNSLGMDNDDLLFNMLYFGGGAQSVGMAINSAMEETVALHSEQNTPYKLQPASQHDVQSLASRNYVDVLSPRLEHTAASPRTTRDCSVCREDLTPVCVVIKLPRCAHVFHDECIKKWLCFQSWCPICRQEVGPSAASPGPPKPVPSSKNKLDPDPEDETARERERDLEREREDFSCERKDHY